MNQRLEQILGDCPKLWRTRKVAQDPEALAFLQGQYPGVPLALQIHSWLTNTSPYCQVCGAPVKTQGKITCSIQCRQKMASQHVQDRVTKQQQTLRERYGVDNIAHIPGARDKRRATLQSRYGAQVSPKARLAAQQRSPQLQVLGRDTLWRRYGVTNPGQLPDHAERCRVTALERHGVEHYRQSQEFRDRQQQQRQQRWEHFSPPTIEIRGVRDASDDKQQVYPHANAMIDFVRRQCGRPDSVPSETFRWRVQNTGTSCAGCANITRGSAAENQLREYIRGLGFDTRDNSRPLDDREIDIFVPDAGLGIEYHGLFWHNDLRVPKSYHLDKLESALRHDIRLIQIFEDEWLHHPHIVRSRLAHLLGKQSRRLQARRCQVRNISADQARQFLEQNHIQGAARSTVKLGLFHGDELVSVMTFSHLTRAKGHRPEAGKWELSRFCNLNYVSVAGAAGKLFQHFVRTHAPLQVLSFADRRWSQGDLYGQLGFECDGMTGINYWYIDLRNTLRIHRYQLRRRDDDAQDLSEYENRLQQGYLRIHDCGSSRWIWKP